jgi:hypothetical protein
MTEHLHEVEEKVEELVHEAEEGQSPRTPLLLVGGVSVVVGAAVVIILALAFLAYYLT